MRTGAWVVLSAFLLASTVGCSSGDSTVDKDTAVQTDLGADSSAEVDTTPQPACTPGDPCDDQDPCTQEDKCGDDGLCAGVKQPLECPVFECASSECDGKGGCTQILIDAGACLINGACFDEGDRNPTNPCQACVTSAGAFGWAPLGADNSCEDGDPCTDNDYCDMGTCVAGSAGDCDDGLPCTVDSCTVNGCVNEPDDLLCDDKNGCTVDQCAPATGCTHTPDDTAVCGDGDVCTLNNYCSQGECLYDGTLDCHDDNPCTDELCHPSFGCVYAFNEHPCDDGQFCTEQDVCHFGRCIGQESYWDPCPACNVEFGPAVQKIVSLRFGSGGLPGEALNVDNDIKTCSPPSTCQNGLDNTLSFAAELVNPLLEENVTDPESTMVILAVLENPTFDGQPFQTSLLYGGLADSNPLCDVQHDVCEYRTGSLSFDPLCKPWVALTNSKIVDNVLTAGGSGYVFPYRLYFVNNVEVEIVIYNAKVEAQVSTHTDGTITHLSGVLAGAVTPEDLTKMVDAIPSQYFPGGDKESILGLIGVMPRDIDVNGDGTKDAFSLGMVFETNLGILLPYITY